MKLDFDRIKLFKLRLFSFRFKFIQIFPGQDGSDAGLLCSSHPLLDGSGQGESRRCSGGQSSFSAFL